MRLVLNRLLSRQTVRRNIHSYSLYRKETTASLLGFWEVKSVWLSLKGIFLATIRIDLSTGLGEKAFIFGRARACRDVPVYFLTKRYRCCLGNRAYIPAEKVWGLPKPWVTEFFVWLCHNRSVSINIDGLLLFNTLATSVVGGFCCMFSYQISLL